MIKVSELRVGNLFYYENEALPVLKLDGDAKKIHLDLLIGLNMLFSEEDIEPIPLTPEWLERCGIVEGRCFYIKQNGIVIFLLWADYDGNYIYDQSGPNVNVKYIHQLQNLYFALTGEELQIKEL